MEVHQLVNQNSGNQELYTPQPILAAARSVLGEIDLDPASSPRANRYVQAKRYWHLTRTTRWWHPRPHPLERPWTRPDGSPAVVWMNHPFSRQENALWIEKLIREYEIGNVVEALCITWASVSTAWAYNLVHHFPVWIPPRRVNYMNPDGTILVGAPKASMVTYLGPFPELFCFQFEGRLGGTVVCPLRLLPLDFGSVARRP